MMRDLFLGECVQPPSIIHSKLAVVRLKMHSVIKLTIWKKTTQLGCKSLSIWVTVLNLICKEWIVKFIKETSMRLKIKRQSQQMVLWVQHFNFSKTHRRKANTLINMMIIVTNRSKFKITNTNLRGTEDISNRTLTKSITTKITSLSSLHPIGFLTMEAASQALVEGENLFRRQKVEKLKVVVKVEDFSLVVPYKSTYSKKVSNKTNNRT